MHGYYLLHTYIAETDKMICSRIALLGIYKLKIIEEIVENSISLPEPKTRNEEIKKPTLECH